MRFCPLSFITTVAFGVMIGFTAVSSKSSSSVRADTSASPDQSASLSNLQYGDSVRPLVTKYCTQCHSGDQPPGGIDLTAFHTTGDVSSHTDIWQKVADNVDTMRMPPQGATAPTTSERDKIVTWIQSTLSAAECDIHTPGRTTLHRLNREEYNNTVDDLLDLRIRPADDFPSDDVGYGFDNIGDVLSMSPLLLEQYLSASEKLARAAIIAPENLDKVVHFFPHDFVSSNGTVSLTSEGDALIASNYSNGVTCNFPTTGEYIIRVRTYGQQAGPDACKMGILLDGVSRSAFVVPDVQANPGVYSVTLNVPAGKHNVDVAFLNDYYNANDPNPNNRDRNLVINRIAVEGPTTLPVNLSPSEALLLPERPSKRTAYDSCAKFDLSKLATRAFRRPVTPDELTRLLSLFDKTTSSGASFEKGMQVSLEALLMSPDFLFRVELDPQGSDGQIHDINDYELASRLSYFIWSSMPDDTLMQLAAENRLHDPAVINAQVQRMVLSPKAQALADNFAGQWLELRKLDNIAPDTKQFPDFTPTLRDDMRTEAEMYFQNIVTNNRSVLEFIDSDYTFLNQELANHYGIDGVEGNDFRLVHLADHNRGGVLTMASTLTVTSNPTRTSPVKRGRWVLEQLLGTPPPPPPPGVPQLDDAKAGPLIGTLRERMIQHRKDPACATCHMRMDPLGFGLENYDAVGHWRTTDANAPIDSSGTLPDGSSFKGPAELKAILMTRKKQFARAFADKLLTYALGRGTEATDQCYIDSIAKTTEDSGYKFWTLIDAVVDSPPFKQRQTQKAGGNTHVS